MKLAARRFWPVVTSTINIDALKRDRDQLFAEAVVLYWKGDPWWPDQDFERKYVAAEQADRYEADAWEEPISIYLDIYLDRLPLDDKRTTVMGVAIGALGYEPVRTGMTIGRDEPQPLRGTAINQLGTTHQRRIAAVLTNLKWHRGKREAGTGQRFWYKDGSDT